MRHLKFICGILICSVVLGASVALSEESRQLTLGLVPEENIFRQVVKHKPLAAYLSEKLGIETKFTILSKYGDVIERFSKRNLDGACFDSFAAMLAINRLSVEPIAIPVGLNGSTTSEGYIIVRKDSGIKGVGDLRGKRAVFVDKVSATGYIFPRAFLWGKGIRDLDAFFSEYYFTGSHESVVYAVLDGRADVGALKGRIFNSLVEKDPMIKDEISIMAVSKPLPETILCVRNNLPAKFISDLKTALFTMHKDPKGIEALKALGASRFAEVHMSDLDSIRLLIKQAGINLRNYRY